MWMLLGVEESAQYLGLKAATIRRWVFERRVPIVKLGRRVLIRREVLEELIRRNERPAGVESCSAIRTLPRPPTGESQVES